MMRMLKLPVALVTMTVALGGILYGGAKPAAAEGIFDDVNLGLVSIGGRATYFAPKRATRTGLAAANSDSTHSNFWPLKAPSTIARRILV